MPLRLTALPPGAFIREHLVLVGGVDYVQAIYASYKAHLRRAGVKPVASRQAMSVYIYKANKMGLIAFDHAERIGDGLLSDYEGNPGRRRPHRVTTTVLSNPKTPDGKISTSAIASSGDWLSRSASPRSNRLLSRYRHLRLRRHCQSQSDVGAQRNHGLRYRRLQ